MLVRYPYRQEELTAMEQSAFTERPSLSLSRSYNATPEKIWRAWTEPEALKQCLGPDKRPPAGRATDG